MSAPPLHSSIPFVLALCASLGSIPAHAQQQQEGSADEAARLTFEAGREAFAAGDYETALARFRSAYEMSGRPMVLYSVAQTLDRMRRDEDTLEVLREFLEVAPADAPIRGEVEARVERLERVVAERRASEERAARAAAEQQILPSSTGGSGEAPEPEPAGWQPPLHPALFIATTGLALAAGGLAVWTGLETLSLHDEYMAASDLENARDAYDEGTTYELATNALIFGGAGLAVVAVVLAIFTDWGGGDEDAATAWAPMLRVDPNGAAVGATLRYGR